MRKSVTEEGVPLFNKEKPYKELDRLDPKATMGTPNSAAIITGDGKVKVGEGHYELMEDNGYKDYADLFAAGGVRIRPAYGGMNIEIGKIDNDVLSRVRKTIASFPGMEFTVEFTPANNRAPKSISGGADLVLLGLEKWQRVGEAAAKYASPSYWHERGNDELFNRVYKSPDADQEEIDDVQGQLDATKDIIHRNPLPTNPDLSTPEKRAAWNEDKEDWNRDYGYNEDHIKALERRLGYLKNKSIGEVRQLPDKTKVVYLTRKGLDDLHEAFGSSYSPNFSINGASLDNLSLSKVFKNLDEYKSPHSREIKKLITQGLDDKGSVTIAMVPEKGQSLSEALATLREELGHTWQKRFEVEAGKHLPEIEFKKLNDAIPAAMSDYLKRNDYKDDDGSDKENKFRVLESAAKMIADNPKALGLSEDEWADYLFQYFESVEKTHGKDALDQLKHITTPARHVKEDYYNAKGNGSGSETDRGVLGGVQGGGEGSPKGTSSEKESDGGASSTDRRVNGGLQEKVDPLFNREQTKTPEFKKFFGDSKIVDKDGEPLVVYHATTADNFDAFDTQRSEMGTHFATHPTQVPVQKDWEGSKHIPVYLKMKNPLRMIDLGKWKPYTVIDRLKYMGLINNDFRRKLEDASYRDWKSNGIAPVQQAIEKMGYDGIVYLNRHEGLANPETGEISASEWADAMARNKNRIEPDEDFKKNTPQAKDAYIAFRPEQIKSAIGNSGSFDPHDPNILRNREKITKSEKFKDWFGDWEDKNAYSSNRDENKPPVSMAVNRDGTPRVMYHATRSDFDTFEAGRKTKNATTFGSYDTTRAGIFFSPDSEFAEEYAKDSKNGKPSVGANVIPTYLNIKFPLRLDGEGVNQLDDDARQEFEKEGINPRWFNSVQHSWELFDDEDGKQFVDAAKKIGYDGAIIQEEGADGEAHEVWVAFDPNQIKSAVGNSGAFSKDDPSILRNREKSPSADKENLYTEDDLSELDKSIGDKKKESLKSTRSALRASGFKSLKVQVEKDGGIHVYADFLGSRDDAKEQIEKIVERETGEKPKTVNLSDANKVRPLWNRENASAAGQESSLESNTSEIGDGGKSQSTVDQGSTGTTPTTVIPIKGGTQLAAAPIQIPVVPVIKVHTILPHQTTAQVSVPLQTAMGVTPVVTKRILPLSELKVLAAGLNPQRKVSNIKDLIAEANRRNPTKMIP